MADKAANTPQEPETISFAVFLEETPPGSSTLVTALAAKRKSYNGGLEWRVSAPDIQLHCADEACNGKRFFGSKHEYGACVFE